jgi:hypothetical protein
LAIDRRYGRDDHRSPGRLGRGATRRGGINHSLAAALPAGAAVGIAIVWTLMRRQTAAWTQSSTAQLNIDAETPIVSGN